VVTLKEQLWTPAAEMTCDAITYISAGTGNRWRFEILDLSSLIVIAFITT